MAGIGYALSSEEQTPAQLIRTAARAEEAGFTFALISDHYHPTHVYVHQVGPDQEGFFDFYRNEVLPKV